MKFFDRNRISGNTGFVNVKQRKYFNHKYFNCFLLRATKDWKGRYNSAIMGTNQLKQVRGREMNEYQVTWKQYRSWVAENMVKGARLVMMIIWCLLAILCLALAVLAGSVTRRLYVVLAVFSIYRAFFRIFIITRNQYRLLAKSYGGENWTRRIAFEEDDIILTEGNLTVRYDYSDIVGIREKGNKIRLDAADKTVLRLYRDAFVESDWEECKRKLQERSEK